MDQVGPSKKRLTLDKTKDEENNVRKGLLGEVIGGRSHLISLKATPPLSSLREEDVLMNPVVLESLFRVASLTSLKNIRLVNRLWWGISLSHFRQKYRLVFRGTNDEDNIQCRVPWEAVNTYLEWVDAPNDPFKFGVHPFQKYGVVHWNLQLADGDARMLSFWERFGPSMNDLKIASSRFYGKEDMRRILFRLTPNLEVLELCDNYYEREDVSQLETRVDPIVQHNLKKLTVALEESRWMENFMEMDYYGDPMQIPLTRINKFPPISWSDLSTNFPNIHDLYLANVNYSFDFVPREQENRRYPEGEYFDLNCFLDSVSQVRRRSRNALQIKHLDIVDVRRNALLKFPRSTLSRLRTLQFPLTHLELDIGVKTSETDFKILLETYAETLIVLKVYRGPYIYPFEDFPFGIVLDSLTELHLDGPTVENLLFLRNTPCLKILRIQQGSRNKRLRFGSHNGSDEDDEDDDEDVYLRSEQDYIVERTVFSLLEAVVMKHLEEFAIGTGNNVCTVEEMEGLTRLMPNLTRIQIGVGNETFPVICKKFKNLEELHMIPARVDDEVLLGIVEGGDSKRRPSLVDLKYLRKLTLGRIGCDNVVYNGILQLPHLTQVSLSCTTDVTHAAQDALVIKFSERNGQCSFQRTDDWCSPH